ncbi:MAG: hypothetical protein IPO21_14370 [Bacteroidales bacterium]|nr:hypothetical protein [Bacteroidales bacterium]
METLTFTFADVKYLVTLAVTLTGLYYVLKSKIDQKADEKEVKKEIDHLKDGFAEKVTKINEDLTKKIDGLIISVTELSSLLSQHIAYHKGKEDAKNDK